MILGLNKNRRRKAVLKGLAAGDRIGGPWQMATSLHNSLMNHQAFDVSNIAKGYVNCFKEEVQDTGITTRTSLAFQKKGFSIEESVMKTNSLLNGKTGGCNPLHRSVPISVSKFISVQDIINISKQEAKITHLDPDVGRASGFCNLLIRLVIEQGSWERAKQSLIKIGMEQESNLYFGATEKSLVNNGYAPNVLRSALYFVDKYDNFDDALDASLVFAGPASYCSVIVGALGGAKWGYKAISNFWLSDDTLIWIERI